MSVVRGNALPPLAWQSKDGTAYDPARFQPVTNLVNFMIKPSGGLWTSPVSRDDGATHWVEWCEREEWGNPTAPLTRIIPDPDARVFYIHGLHNLKQLVGAYPLDVGSWMPCSFAPVDWEKVAADYDAVWLTARGEHMTRYSQPGLYGWDCETVFWLQPRYTVVLDG